jgi:hypothetical protein
LDLPPGTEPGRFLLPLLVITDVLAGYGHAVHAADDGLVLVFGDEVEDEAVKDAFLQAVADLQRQSIVR